MKKILLLCLLMVSSASFIFSQTLPCPVPGEYKINNGGGSCPVVNGVSATGTITLTFDGPIDPTNIPGIFSVTDITDPNNPVVVTDITFGPGQLNNNGTVTYCYYVGPNNNNNLQGGHSAFRFLVLYNGTTPCGEQGTLPVSFRSFTALRSNAVVALKWTTSTESNNLGFEIQRLVGNGKWEAVSFVATQTINGNSSSDLTYNFSDPNSTRVITQYRIRQVDVDGRSKLSEIRVVRGEGQKSSMIVYPNPSSDGKVNVIFDDARGARDVSVTDMSGRTIKEMKGVTNNNIQIDNLHAGFYTVRVMNTETGEQVVEKVIVNKR